MSNKGLIIAITGQSGCGKSTLSAYYRSKGYTVIDCDVVAKYVRDIEDCQKELAVRFGQDIIVDGTVDTGLLSQRAFESPTGVDKLTLITHPYIISEILLEAEEAFEKGEKIVFVDGAVIIGHIFEQYCDKFIVVVSSPEIQTERIMKRDNIELWIAKNRIAGQTPYSEMIKKADFVINNNTDLQKFIIQGEFVLQQLTGE